MLFPLSLMRTLIVKYLYNFGNFHYLITYKIMHWLYHVSFMLLNSGTVRIKWFGLNLKTNLHKGKVEGSFIFDVIHREGLHFLFFIFLFSFFYFFSSTLNHNKKEWTRLGSWSSITEWHCILHCSRNVYFIMQNILTNSDFIKNHGFPLYQVGF